MDEDAAVGVEGIGAFEPVGDEEGQIGHINITIVIEVGIEESPGATFGKARGPLGGGLLGRGDQASDGIPRDEFVILVGAGIGAILDDKDAVGEGRAERGTEDINAVGVGDAVDVEGCIGDNPEAE